MLVNMREGKEKENGKEWLLRPPQRGLELAAGCSWRVPYGEHVLDLKVNFTTES